MLIVLSVLVVLSLLLTPSVRRIILRVTLWLSGVDSDLLGRCTHLRHSEQIRFAGIGALVVIPALVGAASMTYAVSTVTHEPAIYIGVGVVWGLFVGAIDRYLVSTMHKSKLAGRGGRAVSVVVRYLFAVAVGVAVSHPVTLLFFDRSISEHLASNERAAVANRLAEADALKATLPAPAATTDIAMRQARLDCLRNLETAEQAGVIVQLPCGTSSGLPGCFGRCDVIRHQQEEVAAEITQLQSEEALQIADRNAAIAEIDAAAQADIASVRASFSTDYLARVEALSELERSHQSVRTVHLFLLIFFVFIDVLPLTMTLATPASEYEHRRDGYLAESQAVTTAQRWAIANTDYGELAAEHLANRVTLEGVAASSETAKRLVQMYTIQSSEFARLLDEMALVTGRLDPVLQRGFADRVREAVAAFNRSFIDALRRLLGGPVEGDTSSVT